MGNAACCENSSAGVVEKISDKPLVQVDDVPTSEKPPEPSPAPEEPEPSPEVKKDEELKFIEAEVAADVTAAAAKPKPTLEIVLFEKEKDVTLIFEQHPLGLGFGPAPAPGCCAAKPSAKAIVTSVDAKKDILKGVKAGMCFKSVNGTDVREMEWTDFQALLRDAQQTIPKA